MDLERIGPYRIVKKLGQGGMGAVYEGLHEGIERKVAIKILHADHASSPELAERFFNEARVVNRIDHPGLVQVSDHGQTPDGTIYIVMELLKGETLRQRLKRQDGKLSPRDTVYLGRQLAAALKAAHAHGIIHRDLKPENVMVVQDPELPDGERTKILDFGVAKLTQAAASPKVKTKTNSLMGTPRYMSPEQCRGRSDVDDRADCYSLGVMLFEMLAGRPPFEAKGTGELIAMHIYEEPPPLRTLAPDAPPALVSLIERLLQKDKRERPSMQQIVESLEAMAGAVGLGARSPATSDLPKVSPLPMPSENATTLHGSIGQPSQRVRIRRLRPYLLLAGLGLVLVVTLFAVQGQKAKPAPTASPSRTVRWSIVSEPSGAELVSLQSATTLGATPWQSEHAARSGIERIRVQKSGYRDILLELHADSDEQRKITLVPLRPSPDSPAAATRGKGAAKAPPPRGLAKKGRQSKGVYIEVED